MPRYAKNSETRWTHPNYKKAYCYRYNNNMVYISVDSKRKATGYEWKTANKKICLEILNRAVNEKYYPEKETKKNKTKTIQDLIQQFIEDYLSKQNKHTLQHYEILFKQYLPKNLNLDNHIPIREMILDQKKLLNEAPNTQWKKMQRLRKFFNFGVDLEWITNNPVTDNMVPKYMNKNIQLFEKEQIDILINYFINNSNKIMSLFIQFLSITGMRIQEVIDLKWDNITNTRIDFKGKGSKGRTVPLSISSILPFIIQQLEEMNPIKPFTWKNQQTPAKVLKTAQNYLRIQYPQYEWNITAHTIRKYVINQWRNKGIPQDVRNKIFGHSSKVESKFYLTDPELEYIENTLKSYQDTPQD